MTTRQALHAEMYREALESYHNGNLDNAWMCVADCDHPGAADLKAVIERRLYNRALASDMEDYE